VAFDVPRFREPELSRNLSLVDLLRDIVSRHGRTDVTSSRRGVQAIVGIPNAQQVDGVVGAADLVLSDTDLGDIEALMSEDATDFVPPSDP
jgi:aryl-alcohol dehydrogenase-like predicted oxidoreductase